MFPQKDTKQNTAHGLTLAAIALIDSYTDFILSKQAALCSVNTIKFYQATTGRFVQWLQAQGITSPAEVDVRHVRAYLAELAASGKSDRTVADYAGAIRTLVRFWHTEGYCPSLVAFKMPKVAKKRLPVLDADQLNTVIHACDNPRDKALVMLMADSGLRRAEVIALNWNDINMQSGLLLVQRGKGGKARSAVIGAATRRALLAYRRTLADLQEGSPMFQPKQGGRFTVKGFEQIFSKLKKLTGIHITPHSLRRTFTLLSLRNGMDVLHLQALGGWSSLAMVQHYAQMVDEDLLQAHSLHGPIDNL
jgi:site-specific recombinase XerD